MTLLKISPLALITSSLINILKVMHKIISLREINIKEFYLNNNKWNKLIANNSLIINNLEKPLINQEKNYNILIHKKRILFRLKINKRFMLILINYLHIKLIDPLIKSLIILFHLKRETLLILFLLILLKI